MSDYRMSWMNSMTKSAQPTIKTESSLTQSKKPVKPVRKAKPQNCDNPSVNEFQQRFGLSAVK